MKKVILIAIALLIFQQWGSIMLMLNPPPDYSAQHDGKVILYSADWCGYCVKAKKLMTDNNIEYHEYDIEKSLEGREQYQRLNGKGVPLLFINREIVRGYNPERIVKMAQEK